ncbi:MAG: SGNH/GDSL hydrolase family protein [Verrucomicrobia bacterium]|nr:SGNH/GDSL hydrolase family protein [Verrucomicrobiota bacterium]MBT7068894.1 SGNH/GDSL hydrolase family protein [Verrucomicrobiota bacterium]MBT7701949.1 SGNH/GDSL hydrolase family protein [Verrucomicrobiota bacterium]
MTGNPRQTERNRKMKRPLYPLLLLALAAMLVTLAGAEIVLRVLGQPQFPKEHTAPTRFAFTDRGTRHAPFYLNMPGRITFRYDGNPRGYFDALNEVHHDVNPSGFRGPAVGPKEDGTFRMVFLGDSFTFGEGVHNHDAYPEVTARLLRRGGRRVDACNLGVGGYNTSQEADIFKLFGFDMDPDVVVLGYTLNDAEFPLFRTDPATDKPLRRAREAHIQAEGAPARPPASALCRLRLAQAIWKTHRERRLSKQTVEYYLSLHAPSSAGRLASERALQEIISACRERGVPCIVVMFPVLYKLTRDYPFETIHENIGKVVREAGGHYIDLLPALEGQDARTLIVHPTDQHPNEKVHAIAGRLVAEEIRRMRCLQAGRSD